MLDNFGLGEFFFLAILALLFFGPERLPRIGAQFGRWVANLTQYSKAFMNEWRDEALVIQEAVEEVRGIRDEIAAARAEISSTLETARDDVSDGIDVAKDAISGARLDVSQRITQQREESAADLERIAQEEAAKASADDAGEDAAIVRTQQILADLEKKRESALAEDGEGESEAKDGKSGEWERTRDVIADALRRKENQAVPADAQVAAAQSAESSTPGAAPASPSAALVDQGVEEDAEAEAAAAPEPPKETAFDRTQRILDDLKKQRSGAQETEAPSTAADVSADSAGTVPPAQDSTIVSMGAAVEASTVAAAPEPPKETAFDRTQKILDDLKKRREARPAPAAKAISPEEPVVDPVEFEQLSAQVTRLQDEIAALRKELGALVDQSAPAGATDATPVTSDQVSVEEAV
jgi:Sec-independent protein translocase protein TatA